MREIDTAFRKPRLFLIFFLLLPFFDAFAEEIPVPEAYNFRLAVQTDKSEYDIGESIFLEVTLENVYQGKIHDPELPELEGLEVVGVSSRTSFTFVYGRLMRTKHVTFELSPLRPGTHRIPPLSYTILGKTYTSEPFGFSVKGNPHEKKKSKPDLPPEYVLTDRNLPADLESDRIISREGPVPITNRDIFFFIRLDKEKAYVNEMVRVILFFCRAMDLWQGVEFQIPTFVGFLSEEVPLPDEIANSMQKLFNRRYFVTSREWAVYPVLPGRYQIDPFTVTLQVDPQFAKFNLTAQPPPLWVYPLPARGQPENFTGLVGSFDLDSQMDRTQTSVGDPVEFTVRVSGLGNLEALHSLNRPSLNGVEVYEFDRQKQILFSGEKRDNLKEFRFLLSPQTPDQFTVSPFSITYFDPSDQEYKQISTPAYRFSAVPGEVREIPVPPAFRAQKSIVQKRTDMVHIKPDQELLGSEDISPREYLWVTAALVGVPAAFFGFSTGLTRYRRYRGDVRLQKRRRAQKAAQERLREIKRLILSGDQKQFYVSLDRMFRDYLADHVGTAVSEEAEEIFIQDVFSSPNGETGKRLANLLRQCKVGRFAQTALSQEEMSQNYLQAVNLLSELERHWGHRP